MATLGSLIEQVRHQMSGYDAAKDSVAALSAPLTNTGLTLSVDDANGASVGIAEVGLELLRVKSVEPTGNVVNLQTFGRGYRGTQATAHAAGTEVAFNPSWPASTVAQEINGVLSQIYPSVYGVGTYEGTINNDLTQSLPASTVGVISVWYQNPVDETWSRIDDWSFDSHGDTASGRLRLLSWYRTSDVYRVVYAFRPRQFNLLGALTQDFAATTGLEDRLADLILLGVAARMAPFVDISRLPYASTSVREQGAEARPPGQGSTVTRLIYSMFQTRLEQEARVLAIEHPISRHKAVR